MKSSLLWWSEYTVFKRCLNINSVILLIFPIISIALAILILYNNPEAIKKQDAIIFTYFNNALKGRVGYGFNAYYDNDISFSGLEPGDIVLGAYPGCAYGGFSHAGVYIGNGRVLESYVDLGVTIQPIEHYREYSRIALLRVNANVRDKQRAIDYMQEFLGKMFYPMAFKPGERFWNCTKIMWKAYYLQGIDLSISKDLWVAPDEFYLNPNVSIIREKERE